MIDKKRLKSSIIFICVLISLIAFNSCATNNKIEEPGLEEERRFPPDVAGYPSGDMPTLEKQDPPYGFAENPTIFDFAILPEEDYPRGTWTVNLLNNKYGPYKQASISYLPGYEIAFVSVEFERFGVYFYHHPADRFSFYKEGLEVNEYYELNEADKGIELVINSLVIIDPDYKLPYGIKLGENTKTQIISAYGEEPAYYWKEDSEVDWKEDRFIVDLIEYYYHLDDRYQSVINDYFINAYFLEYGENPEEGQYSFANGAIAYSFDENEILSEVNVVWWFYEI